MGNDKRNTNVTLEERLEHLAKIKKDMDRYIWSTQQLDKEFNDCADANRELQKVIPASEVSKHPEYIERAGQIAQISCNMISNFDMLRKLWIEQYFYQFTCAHGFIEDNAILAKSVQGG